MKRLFIILLCMLPVMAFAQRIGSNNSLVHVPGKFRVPLDTASNAPNGSVAYKSGIMYYKNTNWTPLASGTPGASTFFALLDVDSTGMRDGFSPYYDLASGDIKFQQGVSPISTANAVYHVQDSTNTPPVSFPVGEDTVYYMVGGAPAGAWTGLAYKITMYVSGVIADTITAADGDWGLVLNGVAGGTWHQYNNVTWPRRNPPPWVPTGNFGGGVLGSTSPHFVYFRYNNNNRIRLGPGGTFFTQLYGTNNAIATLSSTGLLERREPVASSDTTSIKPVGQAGDGTLYRMSSWFGSGAGGGSSLNVYAPLVKSVDTIHQRFNVLHYGAKGDGATDDTQPIQAAMNAAATAGGGVVIFPYTGSDYIIAGPLVLNGGADSSQLIIPFNGTLESLGSVKLMGEYPVNFFTDYRQDSIPRKMIVLRSTSTKASAVFGTTGSNYTFFSMENICVRVRSRTGAGADTSAIMTAMDLRRMNMVEIKNSRFDTESGQASGLQPTSTAFGIRLPPSGNYAFIKLDNVLVQNYYTGIVASEHANIDNTFISTCYNGISFTSNPHPAIINRATIAWTKNAVILDGTCNVIINQLDIEDYNPDGVTNLTKWYDHVYDFYEPSGSGSKVNAFYFKNVANGIGSTALDNSVTTTSLFTYLAGTALGIPKTTAGLYDYYQVANSTNRYPNITVNTTDASGLGGLIFQRSGTSKFGFVGHPNVTVDEVGIYDYINSRVPLYYSGTSKDLFLNTGINAKFSGNLEITTANAKVGIGTVPTYQLHTSGAAVSNINALISSTGSVGRLAVNSTSNSGVTFQEAGTNQWTFFSAAGVFGIYSDVGADYAIRVNSSRNTFLKGATSKAVFTLPAGGTGSNAGPLGLTTGSFQTTAQAGIMEYVSPQLTFTNEGLQRQEIPLIQQTRRSAQYDAANSTTLTNVGSLFATLVAGKTYHFESTLYTTSNSAGGVKFAIGGTATATDIVYEAIVTDAGVITQSRAAAIGTTVGAVTAVTAAYVKITGTITVNAAGTLTVQFAQNVSNGTASSILRGSTFIVQEIL